MSRFLGGIREWAGVRLFNREETGPRKRSSLSTASQVIFIPDLASVRPAERNLITSDEYIRTVSTYWIHTLCQLLF